MPEPVPESYVPPFSEDALMGGRVRLRQPLKGYRAGMDAALLAAAVDAAGGDRALEAGCGAGAALFQAAARAPGALFTGVERDLSALALAEQNVALNGVEGRVAVRAGDVGRGFAGQGFLKPGEPPFDLAFANPPFFDDPAALRGPAPAKQGAWIADAGLDAWTRFLLRAVREGGRVVMIHRAERLFDVLALLGTQAGSFQVRPVHPFADAPAKRVLVRAVKGGKAPLVLHPPLVLHDRGGAKHTEEAEAVLRGEAGLGWA
ncbi:MAG TPA: methyltransferase domain-containing protein [Caulobacteraceae bacterium]|jgi:tRNA1(Val) A37 N6-methylase TrmN6